MPVVTVNPPATISVRVGTPTPPAVSTINFGNRLHSASDLNLNDLGDGYVIAYSANTDNFYVTNAGTLPLDLTNIDGGYF
jgi:hypothetical protein